MSDVITNHPPQIIKQLLISISNSSNKQVDMSKGEYEKALREKNSKNVSLIYTDKKDKTEMKPLLQHHLV